jgi:hypothetical protein
MRDALSDPETAYVLMTSNSKKTSPSTVTKIATWHGHPCWRRPEEGDPRHRRRRRDDVPSDPPLLPPRLGDYGSQ